MEAKAAMAVVRLIKLKFRPAENENVMRPQIKLPSRSRLRPHMMRAATASGGAPAPGDRLRGGGVIDGKRANRLSPL